MQPPANSNGEIQLNFSIFYTIKIQAGFICALAFFLHFEGFGPGFPPSHIEFHCFMFVTHLPLPLLQHVLSWTVVVVCI